RHDFKFIFYLQPSIYNTEKELTYFEKRIIDTNETRYVGFPQYNSKMYSVYRNILPEDAKRNFYVFIDGDKAIKNEEKSVFFDHVHFGDRGNALIASHLFSELRYLQLIPRTEVAP